MSRSRRRCAVCRGSRSGWRSWSGFWPQRARTAGNERGERIGSGDRDPGGAGPAGPFGIDPAATIESLGLDSLALVEAIFAIEETFGVQVPFNPQDPGEGGFDTSTVASIIAEVEGLVAAKAG